MKKKADSAVISQHDETLYTPFVNEECGDTMWDEVLKEAEERSKQEEWKSFDFFFK